MEDSKLTNRLTLAVYLFLAAVAVILALVGIKYIQSDSPTRDLIINLSTEILGVVIIFIIVNQLFLLNKERDFVKQIESLKDGIKSKFNPLVWESDIEDILRLEEWYLKAKSIYILGYNQAKLLQAIRPILIDSINKGTHVKVLIVNPESIAGDLFRSNSISDDWIYRDFKNTLKYVSDIKHELNKNKKGNIEFSLLNWIPSCHIVVADCENNYGIARIKIYSPSIPLPLGIMRENLFIILKQEEHPREFDYYKKNFELLWNGTTAKIIDDNSFEELLSKYKIKKELK